MTKASRKLYRLINWVELWKRARDHFAWLCIDAPVARMGQGYMRRAGQAHRRWLQAKANVEAFLQIGDSDPNTNRGGSVLELADIPAKEKLH